MKITTMAILLFIITMSIVIFDNTGSVDPSSANLNFYNQSQDTQSGTPTVWTFFKDPSDWGSSGTLVFYLIITLASALTAFVIAAALTKAYAPDTYLFAAWFGILIGFGSIPVTLLYNFIQRELSSYMCVPGAGFCFFPTVLAVMVSSSIGFTWIMTCIKSWRTGSD